MTLFRFTFLVLGIYFGLLVLQGLGLVIIPPLFLIVAGVVSVTCFIVGLRGGNFPP